MAVRTYQEELSRAFYEWERRGRGRDLFPFPVSLEPPYRPFLRPVQSAALLDDGRRHTLLSWAVDQVRRLAKKEVPGEKEVEPLPAEERNLTELRLHLPRELRASREIAEGLLRSLLVVRHSVSFEISSAGGVIRYVVALDQGDKPALKGALTAFLPAVTLSEGEPVSVLWERFGGDLQVLEFALGREFMVPLGTPFQPDPLLPLLSLLAQVGERELALLQVLFVPARRPWPDSVLRAVRNPAGRPFFADAPEVTRLAEEKVSSTLFAAVVRLAVKAQSRWRLAELARLAGGALSALGRENTLTPLSDNPHAEEDLLGRRSHRSGMLLSLSELALLVHLPGLEVGLPAIERSARKEKAPPKEALSGGVLLGEVALPGSPIRVFLPDESRLRHAHLVGATGTGKSTLLRHLILEDIKAGRGVALVDPHGDLSDEVLLRIPEERLVDLVYLDPSDPEILAGWNVLGVHGEAEREVLSSDLVSIFKRYATSWGDQMSTVLANSVAALLALPETYTLSDLRRFLVDRKWRDSLLAGLSDPDLAFFWEKEFSRIGERSLGPILGRLNTFLRSRPLRETVSERRGLDFRALLDRGGILITRLPVGTLGEETVSVLGSLLVSRLHQVALGRVDLRPEERRPFYLYLDEFHLFAGPSLSHLLSGARKFGLSLTVAHQSLLSLHSRFPEIEASLLANAYSRIVFRVGEEDARKLERGLGTFEADDLLRLRTGEAVCRLGSHRPARRLPAGGP